MDPGSFGGWRKSPPYSVYALTHTEKEYKSNEITPQNLMKERSNVQRTVQLSGPHVPVVIVLTLVLFVIALFVKGFSHELLQECGVFLVSVKLIMMSHKNGVSTQRVEERLASIQNLLQTEPKRI